jgi:nicotinamidase-related amidase
VRDAFLLVDVISDFLHEDGEALLACFRARHDRLRYELEKARGSMPVIYANDDWGRWDSDAPALVRHAVEKGLGGDLVAEVAPRQGDHFILKPRYSAFDSTPLELLLRQLETERLLLAGAATEMCVMQTALAARGLDFKVTVLADTCTCIDERHERIALTYLEEVVGVRVEPAGYAAHSGGVRPPDSGSRSDAVFP